VAGEHGGELWSATNSSPSQGFRGALSCGEALGLFMLVGWDKDNSLVGNPCLFGKPKLGICGFHHT